MRQADEPERSNPSNPRLRRVIDDTGAAQDHDIGPLVWADATVARIMSRTTYCLRPDVGVRTAIGMLLEERMSGAPVVDDNGRAIGIVSKTDLLRHLHERGESGESSPTTAADQARLGAGFHSTEIDETMVKEVMMPVVFAIAEDARIPAAAALMAGEGVHRLPVLDQGGAVVGILSTLDIVRWVAEQAGYKV